MIAAFLACLISQTKVVTLDSPGWSVPQILESMAAQTGQKFEAWDDVRFDHVIVHVEDVPFKDFMDRFAKALFSQWTLEDGTYRLDRSPELVAEAEAIAQKSLSARVAQTLAGYSKGPATHSQFSGDYARGFSDQLKAQGPPQNGEDYARIQEVEDSLPLSRALKKLVVSFGPDALAALPVGKRIVLATEPNSLQSPLPESAVGILAQAVQEEDVWHKAVAGIKLNADYESMVDTGEFQGARGGILSFQKQSLNSGIVAELSIYGQAGKTLGKSTLQIGIPQFFQEAGKDITKMNGVGTNVQIDADSVDGLKAMAIFGGLDKPSSAVIKRLLEPTKYDPLSLFASGCLKALGAQQKENVIAYGDLGLILSFAPYGVKGTFDTSWSSSPITRFLEDVQEGQGWITAVPNDFDGYLSMRTNRSALQDLFAPNSVAGWVTVDAAAHFIAAENLEVPDLYAQIAAQVCFGSASCPLDQSDWTLEGIYGMLRPDQVAAAEKGQLLASMLTPAQQKALLEGFVSETIKIDEDDDIAKEDDGSTARFDSKVSETEPTLVFANGLPHDLTIKVTKTSGTCILASYGVQGFNPSGFPIDEITIAWNSFLAQHKPEWASKFSKFQVGAKDKVDLKVEWASGETNATFQSSKATGAGVADWRSLPADIVEEINKQISVYEQQLKDDPNMITEDGADRQGSPP